MFHGCVFFEKKFAIFKIVSTFAMSNVEAREGAISTY